MARNAIVCEAIDGRRLIRLDYDPGLRTIEPHAHGVSSDGNPLLRAYQIDGASASDEPVGWKLFRLDRAESIVLSDETFDGPRPDYVRGDSAMSEIYCQL